MENQEKKLDAAETLSIKVTKIRNRWHARLLDGSKVIDEMACEIRTDIGWICREMMRWYVKTGGSSLYASAARHRHNTKSRNVSGRIWWQVQLESNKARKN